MNHDHEYEQIREDEYGSKTLVIYKFSRLYVQHMVIAVNCSCTFSGQFLWQHFMNIKLV